MLIPLLVWMYCEFINYFLQNCICAIDGTQIDAEVGAMSGVPYRGTKQPKHLMPDSTLEWATNRNTQRPQLNQRAF
jgi:hypothetical protein